MSLWPGLQRPLLWSKRQLAERLCADAVGRVIARSFRDRIPFRGSHIDTSSPVFTPRVKAQLFWGVYESAECRFVQAHLGGTQCAIELGSSLGVVSSLLARMMQDEGRLVCVEANPTLLPVVEAALAGIGAEKRLTTNVIHAAIVADRKQQEASLVVGAETVGSTIVDRPACRDKAVSVPAVTLSEVVEDAGFAHYVLVSDIEGAEISFILADQDALRSCRRMVIELHDSSFGSRRVESDELLGVLIDRGFRMVDRRGPVVVLDRSDREALS